MRKYQIGDYIEIVSLSGTTYYGKIITVYLKAYGVSLFGWNTAKIYTVYPLNIVRAISLEEAAIHLLEN